MHCFRANMWCRTENPRAVCVFESTVLIPSSTNRRVRGFICIIRVQLPYLPAAKKNNSVVKFVSLKQIIRKASLVHHKSFFSWKADFLNFKKRPNINLYVEYWRTLFLFFEDSKLPYKTTKFKAKSPGRDFGKKHELQLLEKYVM